MTCKQAWSARLSGPRCLVVIFYGGGAGSVGVAASWILVSRTGISIAARRCLLVTGIALAAVACASVPPPPHAVVSATASRSRTAAPCRQQYAAWRQGPVRAGNLMVTTELHAVRTAARIKRMTALRSSMSPLMRTALLLAGQPMPRCADPRGIYADFVTLIYTAGHHARSATGLGGLLRAAAVLASAMKVQRQLTAEVSGALGGRLCPPARQGSTPQVRWPPC